MSKCIEKRYTKEFFIVTDANYKKVFEWLFDIHGKELNILDHYIDGNLVYIKYEHYSHPRSHYFPLGDVAIYDKENKRIYSRDQKNFMKEFCILT